MQSSSLCAAAWKLNGRHTDSSILQCKDRTLDGRRESTKRKDSSEEGLQTASKRSRTNQSPSQESKQSSDLSSSSDEPSTSTAAAIHQPIREAEDQRTHELTELPVSDTADKGETKKSSKRKERCEETEEKPRKRSRKTRRNAFPNEAASSSSKSTDHSDIRDRRPTGATDLPASDASDEERSPHESPSQPSTDEAATSSSTSTGQPEIRAEFKAKYEEKELLGEGGYAMVYAGLRKIDNLPVAIKHIPQPIVERIPLHANDSNIPLEVALLMAVGAGPDSTSCNVTPLLLDWYDLDDELIMVLERPVPCMDLIDYIDQMDTLIDEQEVLPLQRQLVNAALEMHSKGVFHRDIKLDNVLIETASDVPRLRFIDFGCGTTEIDAVQTVEQGTLSYTSPEWFRLRRYTAGPTTVWQMGVVLYGLLHLRLPFGNPREIIYCNPRIRADLSDANQQRTIINLMNEIKELKKQNEEQKNKIKFLDNRVSDLEQYSRMNDVIITGLKIKPRTVLLYFLKKRTMMNMMTQRRHR
ncbi:serine/threonine-protein kinase pim-1-like isoform X1 [Scomber scombrus]|uniref:non-specific serine/threonine protein kinase n=1 Tax=Scomber scombrus TaxID=13677 RepID=A0AAV1Q114_SCOSC